MRAEYRYKKIAGRGLPYFAEVKLIIENTENKDLEIVEKYKGNGWQAQGYITAISKEGLDDWRTGIVRGIKYAYSKLVLSRGLKVTIIEANGIPVTDTNPTIIGYAASRAILEKMENNESVEERTLIEELVISSWNYEHDAIPNFNKKIIEGNLKNRQILEETNFESNSRRSLLKFLKEFWMKFTE